MFKITQAQVYSFLKERPNELFTAEELKKRFKINCITNNLKKLIQFGDIPVFRLFRGTSKIPYYTYIEKARRFRRKRGMHINCNETTMVRIR